MNTKYLIREISGLHDRVNGYTRNKVNGMHLHHLRRADTPTPGVND